MQTRIALYPSNEFEFKNQGYGILADTLSAVTTEEAQSNGNIKHELTLVYPLGGRLADELRKPNLIRAPIDGSEDKYNYQVFEIYDYLDDDADGTITVYAQAVGYRVLRMPFDNGGYIKHSGTVQQVLSYAETLISGWPEWFILRSDLTQTVEIDSQFENLGKFIDHLLALTDAQIEHKWNELWIRDRGEHLKPVLRDDKNTIGVTIKHDYDTIINKIIPEYEISGEEGESTKVVGAPILSANPFKYFEYWRGKTVQFKDQSETVDYFSKSGLDEPSLTADIKPNLVDVDFDSVQLFDYVRVKNYKLNFEKELRITSRTFDALACRVTDFKAGSIESNLTTSTTAQIESATSTANDALATADDSKKGVEKLDIIMAETKKKVEEVDQAVIDAARDTKLAVDQADLAVEKATTAAENAGFAKDAANLSVQSAAQAQKDVETAKTNANQALNSAKTALTNAGDAIKTATDAKTTVTNLSTTVDSINGTLATLATNETVNTLAKTVTDTSTLATQNAEAIKLKADGSKVDTLSGNITELSGQLELTNTALDAKITSNDVKNMLGGYATQNWTTGQITAKADSINLGVESIKQTVNSLLAESTNLIKNGDTIYSWVGEHNVTTNYGAFVYMNAPFVPAMYQIEVRAIDDSIIGADFGWQWDGELQGDTIKLTTDWQKATALLEVNKTFGLGVRGGLGLIELRFIKAQDFATLDWTTAQLSITDDKINSSVTTINGNLSTLRSDLTQTSDSLKSTISKVDKNTTNYSSLEHKLNGFQTTVADKADKSQITQLSDQLTSTVGSIGQKNLIYNSEYDNNAEGWRMMNGSYLSAAPSFMYQGSLGFTINKTTTGWTEFGRSKLYKLPNANVETNNTYSASVDVTMYSAVAGAKIGIDLTYYNSSGIRLVVKEAFVTAPTFHKTLKVENFPVPENATHVAIQYYAYNEVYGAITHPMLTFGPVVGPYQKDSPSQSQITQLQSDVNIRVQKGDVINQINISPESILIAGKKVHITGETNIDNAVIKSAMIDSISADKISAGTITGLTINGSTINGATVNAGKIYGATIDGGKIYGRSSIDILGSTYGVAISSQYGITITGNGGGGTRLTDNLVQTDSVSLSGGASIRYVAGKGVYAYYGGADHFLG